MRIPFRVFPPVLAALVACSSPAPPSDLVPAGEVRPAPASVDIASARRSVVQFLDGYAHASSDGGKALGRAVTTPLLERWVHWVGVQNANLHGAIAGRADVRGIRFLGFMETASGTMARFDLDATVSFLYRPRSGAPARREYRFQGPVVLMQRGDADWAVTDATRDGQTMRGAINPLAGMTATMGSLDLVVDSLFTFLPYWSFNLVLRNRTGAPLGLDRSSSALSLAGAVRADLRPQAFSTSLRKIPPGEVVEGQVIFPTPTGTVAEFRFGFRAEGRKPIVFRFPVRPGTGGPSPSPPTIGGA